jgi:uncharacterized ferritin-like protein (DUF455 family)
MELRAFAEQVLFATTLDEKLQRPEAITDEQPGSAIIAPARPGRPAELQFKSAESSGEARFPRREDLEHERERGRLLHFFANHELLATELMALVLLRFPDAPSAFRRGVLQTLKDEQEHTRWYVERMRACGIRFGELPVSGYFWRAVSGMENPMDYVAGLSLTFEQANLDFARHFAGCFKDVGDTTTAALLENIYRDEIGHVAYGLKWFRRWKNPTESDWEAFCRQLKFPLSPQRAKGFSLNVEGRRAAGLDPEFIARLDVFAHSKGRTPNVFVFNPFAEGFIAQGRSFTPVKHQAQLAQDLANVPMFLARQDDIVLVPQSPRVEFRSELKQLGFALPEFVELKAGRIEQNGAVSRRKLAALRPWAWGPDSLALLEPLFCKVTQRASVPEQFAERMASLYSKAWSAELLKNFLATVPAEPWLCPATEVGTAVSSVEEALDAVRRIRERGHHRVVIKEALGLAGQNAIRLWEPEIQDSQRRWMARVCEQGRQLVVEPWLERVRDFSVQFEMSAAGLKLCGFTGLLNDHRGQFQANWAAPNYSRRLPDLVTRLFGEPKDVVARMHDTFEQLRHGLERELTEAGFQGPVGIDAFVYRDGHGTHRLKPVVEINPRYTMGRLTLELMKHTQPGRHGLFRLVTLPQARAAGAEHFQAYAAALKQRWPVVLAGQPQPRVERGAVCLNDPATAQVCLATFQVSRDAAELNL